MVHGKHAHGAFEGGHDGVFCVFKSETGSIVNLCIFVVIEGGCIGAAADTLALVGVFRSEIIVIGHAIAIDVVVHGITNAVAVHVGWNAGRIQ